MVLARLTERAVPLESQRQRLADVHSRPRSGLELPLVLRAGQITLERGIGDQLHASKPSLEDRGQLGGSRTLTECRPGGLVLGAEADIHRQTPRRWGPEPRPQAPTRVLESQARDLRAEDVASEFPVIGDPVRHLSGEAPLALRGRHRTGEPTRPTARIVEVAFQLPFAVAGGGVRIDGDVK